MQRPMCDAHTTILSKSAKHWTPPPPGSLLHSSPHLSFYRLDFNVYLYFYALPSLFAMNVMQCSADYHWRGTDGGRKTDRRGRIKGRKGVLSHFALQLGVARNCSYDIVRENTIFLSCKKKHNSFLPSAICVGEKMAVSDFHSNSNILADQTQSSIMM